MDDKPTLRTRFQAQRDALDPATVRDLSQRIMTELLAMPEVAKARSVFCYVGHGNEVQTDELLEHLLDEGKQVAVPRIVKRGVMEARLIGGTGDLKPDRHGIPSVSAQSPSMQQPDVVVMPCVAATRDGRRLGMGGGYYDRWLAAHPDCTSIVLAYDVQVVGDLPTEPHDQRVNAVVDESHVWRCEGTGTAQHD